MNRARANYAASNRAGDVRFRSNYPSTAPSTVLSEEAQKAIADFGGVWESRAQPPPQALELMGMLAHRVVPVAQPVKEMTDIFNKDIDAILASVGTKRAAALPTRPKKQLTYFDRDVGRPTHGLDQQSAALHHQAGFAIAGQGTLSDRGVGPTTPTTPGMTMSRDPSFATTDGSYVMLPSVDPVDEDVDASGFVMIKGEPGATDDEAEDGRPSLKDMIMSVPNLPAKPINKHTPVSSYKKKPMTL